MEALLEKNILESEFPFRLFINEGKFSFPHHWHDEIEIVYSMEGLTKVGVNNMIYELYPESILLIGSGDVHYYLPLPEDGKKVIIQFNLSIFDSSGSTISDKRFIRCLFDRSKKMSSQWDEKTHKEICRQIREVITEYAEKKQGYKLALKARLFDLVVILLRYVPMEDYSTEEETKHREKLKRLEAVFQYVENNYTTQITLDEVAAKAGFSLYHFTRFFKENTGLTFGQFLNNYRITKAEWHLINKEGSITEIAYKAGFNSLKTFNRIFKQIKGCSPSDYLKKQNMRNT